MTMKDRKRIVLGKKKSITMCGIKEKKRDRMKKAIDRGKEGVEANKQKMSRKRRERVKETIHVIFWSSQTTKKRVNEKKKKKMGKR